MNQSSPICVLYLSHASNNEGNGRMKGENSDDHTLFSVPQIFFYPHKDKNPSLQRQFNPSLQRHLPFVSKRLSNFLYTKVEKLLFGKG